MVVDVRYVLLLAIRSILKGWNMGVPVRMFRAAILLMDNRVRVLWGEEAILVSFLGSGGGQDISLWAPLFISRTDLLRGGTA